jgi:hypothetical protein
MYRLASDTLVGQVTRIRLEDYSREAGYATCALKHPSPPSRKQSTNHVSHINRILHDLNFSLDTDEINISTDHADLDCELVDLLPKEFRHHLAPSMGEQKIFFLSQISDFNSLTPYPSLRIKFPSLPPSVDKAPWYSCLRETLTLSRNGPLTFAPSASNLITPLLHNPAHRGRKFRVDPYDLQSPTYNQEAINVPGAPQIWTSDGSLKHHHGENHASTALVGVQNACGIFTTRLAGHQSVYKAELLSLIRDDGLE